MLNQKRAPLLEAIQAYNQRDILRLHVPAHGGGSGLPNELHSIAGWDVTELPGLDDLHNPNGVIAQAQELLADLYGAKKAFFLVNGTTVGLQALIAASCRDEQTLVLPRNAHRCVLGGLLLSNARPVFLEPEIVPHFEFAAGFSPQRLEAALSQNPGVGAVLAVHPVYYGAVGNLAKVAQICRHYQTALITDEAHGTHLSFHQELPAGALSLGAWATVQSAHKTGGALTQTAWLLQGQVTQETKYSSLTNRILFEQQIKNILPVLQTGSPSYLLMASLDAARRQLALKGSALLDDLLCLAHETAEQINRIPGMSVFGKEHLDGINLYDYDATRLVISLRDLGLDGYQAARWLAEHQNIFVEMADHINLVAVLPLGMTRENSVRLIKALADLSRWAKRDGLRHRSYPVPQWPELQIPKQIMTPRQAWLKDYMMLPLAQCRGLVSSELIAVFPPGIPVIYPGEEITPQVIEYLAQARDDKISVQGAADCTLAQMRVVKE